MPQHFYIIFFIERAWIGKSGKGNSIIIVIAW